METIGVLAFQKVAQTGNIGKKNPVAGDIDYVRPQHAEGLIILPVHASLKICSF